MSSTTKQITLDNCYECWRNKYDLTKLPLVTHYYSSPKIDEKIFEKCSGLLEFEYHYHDNVEYLPEKLFYTCINLTTFILNGCDIKSLPENLFKNCPNLIKFDISDTDILKLFYNCPNLNQFICNDNDIEELHGTLFKFCPNLEEFICHSTHDDDGIYKNCRFDTLPEELFKGCNKLFYFKCSVSDYRKLPIFPESIFSDCILLETYEFNFKHYRNKYYIDQD